MATLIPAPLLDSVGIFVRKTQCPTPSAIPVKITQIGSRRFAGTDVQRLHSAAQISMIHPTPPHHSTARPSTAVDWTKAKPNDFFLYCSGAAAKQAPYFINVAFTPQAP